MNMNINNNNPINFGMKVNKNLASTLKRELNNDCRRRSISHTAKSKYETLTEELNKKLQEISDWGENSYELFETFDKLRDRRTIGIRKKRKPNNAHLFKPLGKNLLKRFLTLKKEIVFKGIIKLENATKVIKNNLK